MIAKTYLDGTLISEPEGIGEISQVISYDDEFKWVVYKIDSDLIFHNDGYDYLENIALTGYCTAVEFLLRLGTDSLTDYFEGVIHLPDTTDLNLSRETLQIPISDNSIQTYIRENLNIKCYPNTTRSKNDVLITAVSPTLIQYFTPSTGVYSFSIDQNYKVNSVFRYMVDFISDGQMAYASTFFGAGAGVNICLVTGLALRDTGATAAPFVSFSDLFNELNVIYNLSIYIDDTTTIPTLYIERTADLYTETALMTFTDVKDLKAKFDKEKLYAKIEIGSAITQEPNGIFTFPAVKFLGFDQEEYHVGGTCNLDRSLNLVNKYIIDSNVIEDVLLNANDQYDDEIFIVETDGGNATRYDNLVGATFVYNLGFNNFNKSQNHIGSFPNDLILYLNNETNGYVAQDNSVVLATGVLDFPTEISDPGSNYVGVTGIYTAPLVGDGTYAFTFDYAGLSFSSTVIGVHTADIYLKHYTSGMVLIEQMLLKEFYSEVVTGANSSGSYSGAFYLAGGEKVTMEVVVLAGTTSFSLTTSTGVFTDDGGVYQAYNPNDYRILNLSFNYHLTQTQFLNIRNNIFDKVTIQTGNKTFKGWIRSLKRNIITGMSEIEVRTSNTDRL